MPTVPPEIVAAAQDAERCWSVPASISLGQWALESGWGTHVPPSSNNPFGIKAVGSQPYVVALTHEVTRGVTRTVTQRFRRFASLDEAFDEHARLLATEPQYARARAYEHSPDQFATQLTGVYATDPHYGTLLRAVMHGSDLFQYDTLPQLEVAARVVQPTSPAAA